MKTIINIFLITTIMSACTPKSVDTSIYLDPSQPIEERVEALLSQMTLEEKIGQMDMVAIWDKEKILEQGKFDYGASIGEARPKEINKNKKS